MRRRPAMRFVLGTGLTYSWSFGDGSPATAAALTPEASHVYQGAQHYTVLLVVKDVLGQTTTFSRRQTITYAVTSPSPRRTSTIVLDSGRGRIAVVNSDASTVASIDTQSPFSKRWEMPVGENPQTLAQPAPNGDLWVANQDSATISVLDGDTGALKATITLPRASRPYGVVFDPAGANAYVTLEATGRLLRIDPSSRAITGDLDVGPRPRGIAVSSDGSRIFVTRFLSAATHGEVREVSASSLSVVRTFSLVKDVLTLSSESDGPGLPNYLQSITITPDGRGAWVPSKKDNIDQGTGPTSDGQPLTFDSRVRTMVSKLDLVGNTVDTFSRRDVNNSDLANAVVFNALGDYAFVSTQGNNHIEVYDALSHNSIASIENTGLAPRGLVLSGSLLFVQNFMSRDVAVFDVSNAGGTNLFPKLGTVSTQAVEPLAPQVLQGKRVFYNSADPRMSREAYISCASCHLDGDHDGQVWDFTQAGEGIRNTTSLKGKGGVTEQGPVHWTGNFDEIQDFEHDIRNGFGGEGFLTDEQFATGTRNHPLGDPKAGLSAELDALAAYVQSLRQVDASPYRNPDGTMTADALAGRAIFESPLTGCTSCHAGLERTDSAVNVLHDVGTLTLASGQRLGQTLTGLDTPTLVGLWATAPYLHDGSAKTLMEVITTRNPNDQHGTTSHLTETEKGQLVAFLRELDETDASPVLRSVDVITTDSAGAVTTTFESGKTVYWRVKITDGSNAPVPLASVTTQVTKPNGAVWTTLTATTDAEGWAQFSKRSFNKDPAGTYTIQVIGVSKSGYGYDPARNLEVSTAFVLQ